MRIQELRELSFIDYAETRLVDNSGRLDNFAQYVMALIEADNNYDPGPPDAEESGPAEPPGCLNCGWPTRDGEVYCHRCVPGPGEPPVTTQERNAAIDAYFDQCDPGPLTAPAVPELVEIPEPDGIATDYSEQCARRYVLECILTRKPIDARIVGGYIGLTHGALRQWIQAVSNESGVRNSGTAQNKGITQRLGDLIAAIHDPDDDDDAAAEAAFPAPAKKVEETPGYVLQAGYANKKEYQAAMAFKKAKESKGETFDQAAYLKGYRARLALREQEVEQK